MKRFFYVALLAVFAFGNGFSQSPDSSRQTTPPQLQPRPANSPADVSREIMLDVQVTDHSGTAVRGLQQEDFTLLDDKQPQDILSFREANGAVQAAADPVTEIFLVVDAVNTGVRTVPYERDAIKQFLLRNGGQLPQPVSLIVFTSGETKIQSQPSRDGKSLVELYDQYETGLRTITRSQGFYGAEERFTRSINTLNAFATDAAKRPGRKLMVWFSPGWPLLSGPSVRISDKAENQLFDQIVSLSNKLRQARVTLYVVDPIGVTEAGSIRSHYYENFLKGVSSPSHAVPGNLGLQVLAIQSGGRVFNGSNDLANELANCVADAEDYYVLSFNGHPADKQHEYHALTLKVNKPGFTVRTRSGYYAQP